MTALDWRSAGLGCTADPDWRAKLWRGGLLLMVPFVGWPFALGYRRLFVERLLDGARPLLPEWHGNHAAALRGGLAAIFVIHAWYTPLYVWLAIRTSDWQLTAELPWIPALAFVVTFSIFSTLIVPAWLAWLRFVADAPPAPLELLTLGLCFAVLTFHIPAGFLNVSRTRRIVSAFDLRASLRQIATAPRRYLEAWLGSGVVSLIAHLCLPLAPWAVVWCYLTIVHAFNEVPRDEAGRGDDRSWYPRFAREHWQPYLVQRIGPIEEYRRVATKRRPEFRALRVGPLRILLPSRRPAQE